MKSASAQTGNFPAGLSWCIAHLDPPRCPGHLLWVRGGAGSCLTSLMRYTLCPPVSVCDPRGSTDCGGRTVAAQVQPRRLRLRDTLPRVSGLAGPGQGTGTPSPPCCPTALASGGSGVGLGPTPPGGRLSGPHRGVQQQGVPLPAHRPRVQDQGLPVVRPWLLQAR